MTILEECMELTKGAMQTELEIRADGRIHVLCPCCEGAGEHDTLPGNNPDNNVYRRRTCEGQGDIDREFRESHRSPQETNPDWPGTAVTSELELRRDDGGTWMIGTGPDGHITQEQLVRFAHRILGNLESSREINRNEWIRQYRRLSPGKSIRAAEAAWKEEHTPAQPGAQAKSQAKSQDTPKTTPQTYRAA